MTSIAAVVALVLALVLAFALGGLATRAYVRRTSAPPAPVARPSLRAAIARSRYEIQRDGHVFWHGDDALLAKQWWEAAQHEPPTIALAFLQDGALRDRRVAVNLR